MATIRKDIQIESPAHDVWSAVADTGAIHERFARGFVVDTQLEGDTRVVTFVNGAVVRELLVDIDDSTQRIAYAIVDSPLGLRHHNASMQVVADGERRSTLVWTVDIAPDSAAAVMSELMDQGALAMQHTLEGVSR